MDKFFNIYRNFIERSIFFVILLLGISLGAQASTSSVNQDFFPERLLFYFGNNSSLLVRDYNTNRANLDKLDAMLREPEFSSSVDSIVISGGASLTGSFQVNTRLAHERAAALRTYIRWKHPGVYNDRISIRPVVFDWGILIDLIENDPLVPNRDEALSILKSSAGDQSKVTRIKQLGGGSTDTYLNKNYARYMRTATSVFFAHKEKPVEIQEPEIVVVQPDPVPAVVEEIVAAPEEVIAAPETLPQTAPVTLSSRPKASRPLFALKTNLLFDVASALNLEVEVPIGQRWSVAGEWIFPWWLWEKKQYALEILNGNIEGRYWWGERSRRDQLTGWFTGVYAGGGYYDVEWKTKGYQGEFFSAGITGGYAHKIGRNLRMEYSLGIGYLTNKYREYVPQQCGVDDQWHLIKRGNGTSNWIGPTRAKVSLVWMINSGNNKK